MLIVVPAAPWRGKTLYYGVYDACITPISNEATKQNAALPANP
jgi:hypothetical protein